MRIDAAVLDELGGPFTITELELEQPRPDEILVRLAGTGICHTDVKVASGYRGPPVPVVLGHEGAGVVVEIGDEVSSVAPGDAVVLSFPHCGRCRNCTSGRPAVCHHFQQLSFGCSRPDGSSPLSRPDGGSTVHGSFFGQSSFATHAVTSERNAVRVEPGPATGHTELALLGPLGCGVSTGAGAVLNSLAVTAGSSLVVLGVGTVGLSAVMAARVAGADTIVAVDRHHHRLALAAELGATDAIDTGRIDADGLVEEILGRCGGGADHALDTTNVPALSSAGVACLAIGGSYGHVGGGGTELTVDTGHLLAGRTITGILQGDSDPRRFIPRLLELHAAGRFPFERLITTYDLADIDRAVADMRDGSTIKPVLRMPAGP